ncbi:structural maintenance of chromosomes protein 6-like [Anopheles albimanus]|uniref:Structural maintenance of chromosomes protein 6 n=1 Tax=Anopheles albimanus TaxID=7167 RepID=A0A1Y9G8J5_ANOAL|nr:structural maintenance of chromosomes protein 6-like [Anopheles albimanus]
MSGLRKRSQHEGLSQSQAKRTRTEANDDERDPDAVDEGQNEESEEVRNGKVLRMVLKNFMCHRHMVVEFNKRANLLVGKNGSGKSAILAAMTIGLGCNAMQTNRCSSLKDLIKHGESQAVIEIHLENSNFDCYERERYGSRIVCERTISATGAGSYKLKNANGHTISTSRNELQKILLAFNIQVDNPICVLNQDLARSLLKDSDESKQYMFFAKATQIDTIKLKLNQCAVIAEQLRHILSVREQSLKYLRQEVDVLEEKHRNLASAGRLGEMMKDLQTLLAWRTVADQEEKLAEVDQEIERLRGSIREQEDRIANRGTLVEETNRTVQMLRVDIEGKKTEFSTLKAEYMKLRQAMQDALTQQASIERSKGKTSDRLTRMQDEIRGIEQELSDRSKGGMSQVEQEKVQVESEQAELRERLAELSQQIEQVQGELATMHNTLTQLKDTREQRHHERIAKRSQVASVEEQLEQLKRAPRNKLAIYGANMPALDTRIRQLHREGKFSELPRGPLGQYIEVRDRKWASIVETALGSSCLSAFFVATQQDWSTLDGLLRREFPDLHKCTIFTGRFAKELYDVQQGCVQELDGTHLLMNLIKVADPVVMNRLIDSAAIDTILVTEQQSIAIQLTSEVENVPENLSKVIVTEPCSEFYPQPRYRSYAIQLKPARYLQVSMGELRQRTERQCEELRRELVELNASAEEAQLAQQNQTRELHKRQKALNDLQQEMHRVEQRMVQLQSVVFVEETEEASLRRELVELRAESEKLCEKLETERGSLESVQAEVRAKEVAVLEKKKSMVEIENAIRAIQLRIEDEQQKRQDLQTNEQMKRQALQRCEDAIREQMAARSTVAEDVEKARVEALAKGSRVETTETVERLKQQIHSTDKRIRKMTQTNDNIDDIKQKLDQKIVERDDAVNYTAKLRDIMSLLNNTREDRFAYLEKLISHMSLRVKHKFKTIMQLRSYVGSMKINREAEKLTLSVVPRDAKVQNSVSSTKSLSGGERSFATVAFLIALWSCVDTPFFFLDEYDVFTDQLNRHTMTQLLINEASKKPDRQFCFLTPQDMSEIQASSDLTIHRMDDPERC